MVFGKHINKYYLKYLPLLLLGIISLVTVDALQLVIPRLYQLVVNGINYGAVSVDGVEVPFNMEFLLGSICLPLLGIIFAMVLGRFLWRVCFFGTGIRVETCLREEMFDHAKDLSCQFYATNKVGNLMSLFTNDLDTIQECVGWGILMFFDATVLGLMAVWKMYLMDPLLTLLALVPMVLLLICASVVGHYMTKKWDVCQEAFSQLSDFSQESFSGIAVVKAFVKEYVELLTFQKHNEENERVNVEFTRASVLLRILTVMLVESVICTILGYGGYLVYLGKFNAGQLVEFIGYFNATVWPIMAVSELIDMTSRGKASLLRIQELLETKSDVVDRPDVTEAEIRRGEIEFRNLTFRYPGSDRDVLTEVSFTVPAGAHVGVVGATGSGKTTLMEVLLRNYNVPDGTLFVDGMDVNTVSIRSLRNGCAYVPQDNFLFSDTIANNIAFRETEDIQAVEAAAVLADIDDNIRGFPKGYKTVLGERGVTVSGGQKQRISIARGLLPDAPILILDDSVSAVDVHTERTILQNLRRCRGGKTTLLIAHRISTVENLDYILYIKEGRVVAFDTHQKLVETCPDYRKEVRLQSLHAEGGALNG